jgi:hypothetical protein
VAGKVTLEERFVEGHVLERGKALAGLVFDYAINQQERESMRQELGDSPDVDRPLLCRRFRFIHCGVPCFCLRHFVPVRRDA